MPVRNSARLSAAVLALTLSLGPASAQYAFAGPEKAAAVSSVHIDNFGRVDATYYRRLSPIVGVRDYTGFRIGASVSYGLVP